MWNDEERFSTNRVINAPCASDTASPAGDSTQTRRPLERKSAGDAPATPSPFSLRAHLLPLLQSPRGTFRLKYCRGSARTAHHFSPCIVWCCEGLYLQAYRSVPATTVLDQVQTDFLQSKIWCNRSSQLAAAPRNLCLYLHYLIIHLKNTYAAVKRWDLNVLDLFRFEVCKT